MAYYPSAAAEYFSAFGGSLVFVFLINLIKKKEGLSLTES